jgi:glycosyltransferase involved in cell wall biosynthesis
VNIALVTETFPPEINGVAMTFGVIARELGRRGHEVTVYHPGRRGEGGDGYREVPMRGFPIPGYGALRLGLPAGGRLRELWRTARPDLVHVATEGPLGASSVGAARAAGIPVTSSFHTNFHAYARHYGVGLLRRAAVGWLRRMHNRTARTFAPTSELCAELEQLGFLNLAVLSRGVDTVRFRPDRRSEELRRSWGAGPDDPVVFHAGRMAPEKNYGLLFRAYEAMRRGHPRCRFVLVGDGPLSPGLRRGHPEAIFTGFVPRDELARHFASADIYVHASLTETFGNVLTEAMASGLAVAAFDYAAAREFIRNGVSGLAVPVSRPDALVDAAVRLAADPGLRDRLRSAAAAAVLRQSWEDVVGRFEAELIRVANGGG